MISPGGSVAPSSGRVAVVAHYDASHRLAHHVRLLLLELLDVCDSVVLVSTTGIDYSSQAWAATHYNLKVVTRTNQGYDFMSYKEGLRHLGSVDGKEVIICNDSFVGPVIPMKDVLAGMDPVDCDFWGMTENYEHRWHVQSYFLVFRPSATRTSAFHTFWDEMVPISDRAEVIHRYELGLSRRLSDAGLVGRAYFELTPEDVWQANERHQWWTTAVGPDGAVEEWRNRVVERYLDETKAREFNSTVVLADRVLSARLPVLKLDIPRLDPFSLDGKSLLDACIKKYPGWFQRVPAYIAGTDGGTYVGRHAQVPVTADTQPIQDRVRYRSDV